MAKRAINSKEARRTLCLKFLTDTGKIHTICLNCAAAISGAEDAKHVKRVMEKLLEYDIFTAKLAKPVSAELVERRVILTADDFQIDEEREEPETGVAPEEKKAGCACDLDAAEVMSQAQEAEQGAGAEEAAAPAVCYDGSGTYCGCLYRGLPAPRLSAAVVKREPMTADYVAVTRSPPFLRGAPR